MKKPLTVNCPHCKKTMPYDTTNIYRPFCSKRCQLIDLGAWAAEEHVITGNDLLSEMSLDDLENLINDEDQPLH